MEKSILRAPEVYQAEKRAMECFDPSVVPQKRSLDQASRRGARKRGRRAVAQAILEGLQEAQEERRSCSSIKGCPGCAAAVEGE